MKTCISFLAIFLIAVTIGKMFGQQTQLPDLMPNSPNVEAMQQYGNYPVGHYTGIPSINIPLYVIKSGDITVPISLSYHASGIKVSQEASWVGLGWSLNAGGSLSKQKRSFDDFGHYESTNYHFKEPIIELSEGNKNGDSISDAQYLQYFKQNRRDLFPDLYFYSFLGYSGKFIFDDFPQGTSVKRGDGLKFNIDNLGNTGVQIDSLDWRVQDLKGLTYGFRQPVTKSISTGDIEASTIIGVETTVSSWLLTSITSNTNKEVVFDYDYEGLIRTPQFKSYTTTLKVNSLYGPPPAPYDNDDLVFTDVHLPDVAYSSRIWSTEDIDEINLKRIDFDEGYVLFITTNRSDLFDPSGGEPPKKLSSIEVYDIDDHLVKGFEFEYTYVNESSTGTDHYYKKLSLESVQEYYINENDERVNKNPHLFEYIDRPSHIDPIIKNSDKIDHWGYWGRSDNEFSTLQRSSLDVDAENDATPVIINEELSEYGDEFSGNNPIIDSIVGRSLSYKIYPPGHNLFNTGYLKHAVDTVLNKVYTLKSITYPTKGKTEFDLETNTYSNYYPKYTSRRFAGWPVEGDIPVVDLPEGPETPVYDFTENKIHLVSYLGQTDTDEFDGLSKGFTITNTTRVRLDFMLTIAYTTGAEGVLKRQDGSVIIKFKPNVTNEQFRSVQGVKLPPGDYILEVNTGANFGMDLIAEYIDYRELSIIDSQTVGEFDYQLGGGLRVKSIRNYDSNDTLVGTTQYDYTREGKKYEIAHPEQPSPIVRRSSGKLLSPIQYGKAKRHEYKSTLEVLGTGGNHTASEVNIISVGKTFSSSPIIPVASSANGQSIGYDQVSVSKTDGQNNPLGKTVYYYKNELETVAEYGTSIPNEVHLDNGQLLKQEDYNNAGELLYSKENHYSSDDYQPYMYGLSRSFTNSEDKLFAGNLCQNLACCKALFKYGVKYSDYRIRSEWWHLDESIETLYDLNGDNPVVKTTNYEYNNNKSYQPTRTSVHTSTGDYLETLAYYPDDITGTSSLSIGGSVTNTEFDAIERLQFSGTSYQPANVIQTETYNDKNNNGETELSELLSLQRVNFKNWDVDNDTQSNDPDDIVLLETVQSSKGNVALEDQIIYHKYNENGKPLEVSKANGIHIVYIWGYNQVYPVAKIENATYSQVIGTLTTANLNNIKSGSYSDSSMRTTLNKIRNHVTMKNAMVTTYTYDPLIGVTSMTDPKGSTVYYEYDDFKRLKLIRNTDGYIVSENEYHYKTPPEQN
ncbi:hypothetical protein [uncultured Algibacter sp.]|uniref:hypothetical protein n=1 Tax=uncultured Algibacter sp. TaxID=298659 RepID=UPI00261D04BE|nr:hypothetical protein [uncultured Algibacter sp.]